MFSLFKLVQEGFAILGAAADAASAVREKRMPSQKSLQILGLNEQQMRTIAH